MINQIVNVESMSNKKASIVDCGTTIEEVITKRDVAQSNWNEINKKSKKIRNQCLFDCGDVQITGDEETDE